MRRMAINGLDNEWFFSNRLVDVAKFLSSEGESDDRFEGEAGHKAEGETV